MQPIDYMTVPFVFSLMGMMYCDDKANRQGVVFWAFVAFWCGVVAICLEMR